VVGLFVIAIGVASLLAKCALDREAELAADGGEFGKTVAKLDADNEI
jgi:hypothetical protein